MKNTLLPYFYTRLDMKQILIISLLIHFITLQVFAQDDGQWTHYPLSEGLEWNQVTALVIDNSNTLWAANKYGIHRFEGEEWITYSPEEIGTPLPCESMVSGFDGTLHFIAGHYMTFSDNIWINHSTDIPPDIVPRVLDVAPNGDVWLGGGKGVLHFDGTSWKSHIIEDQLPDIGNVYIESLALDKSGNVWCGTSQDGVFIYDGENWKQFTEEHGLEGTHDIYVKVGADGTVWCVGNKTENFVTTGWLARYEGNNLWKVIDGNPLYHYFRVIEVDLNGKVWIGNELFNFASFDGKEWKEYSLPEWQNYITALTVDNNGIVWIGTAENGIYRFDPNPTAIDGTTQYPVQVSITGNYPNPFNGDTLISFQTPESAYCDLSIYSMSGQLITTLISNTVTQGGHRVYWNGKDAMDRTVSSGMYVAKLQLGSGIDTHKMTFTK